jgi:hypothetical protein
LKKALIQVENISGEKMSYSFVDLTLKDKIERILNKVVKDKLVVE